MKSSFLSRCITFSAARKRLIKVAIAACGGLAFVGPTTASAQTFSSGPINLAIPDGSAAGVTAIINAPGSTGIISDLDVRINANHTWVGDLIFRVTSPDGSMVTLLDRPGIPPGFFGNSSNLNGSYLFDDDAMASFPEAAGGTDVAPGSYRSADALAVVNGEMGAGDWTLFVSDNAGLDFGQINFWELILTTLPSTREGFGAAAQANVQATNQQYGLLSDQIAIANRKRSNAALAFNFPIQESLNSNLGSLDTINADDLVVRGQNCDAGGCGLDGWIVGFGSAGSIDAPAALGEIALSSGGTQFGVYEWIDQANMIGFFGSYNHSRVRLQNVVGVNSVDTGLAGLFWRHGSTSDYFTAAASLGYDDYNTVRGTAIGNTNGMQGAVYVEKGWTRQIDRFEVTPSVALQYTNVHQSQFTEQGVGAVTVLAQDTNSLRSTLGLDVLGETKQTEHGGLTYDMSAHWAHEFLDTNTTSTTAFGGATFATRGIDFGRDWAILGVGAQLETFSGITLFGGYDVQINDRQDIHTGHGGLLIQF